MPLSGTESVAGTSTALIVSVVICKRQEGRTVGHPVLRAFGDILGEVARKLEER